MIPWVTFLLLLREFWASEVPAPPPRCQQVDKLGPFWAHEPCWSCGGGGKVFLSLLTSRLLGFQEILRPLHGVSSQLGTSPPLPPNVVVCTDDVWGQIPPLVHHH